MATFEFTSPDGKTYEVEGPEGSTKEQAFQQLQKQLSSSTGGETFAKSKVAQGYTEDQAAAMSQIPTGGVPGAGPTPAAPGAQPASEWERTMEGMSAGAMAVPAAGLAAGGILKAMGKAPGVIRAVPSVTQGVLQTLIPQTGKGLAAATAGGAALGGLGANVKNEAEMHGASPQTANAIEMATMVAVGGLAAGAKPSARAIKELADVYRGLGVKDAAAKAEAAITQAAQKTMGSVRSTAASAKLEEYKQKAIVEGAMKQRQAVDAQLAAPKPQGQTYGETGKILENSFKSIIDDASAQRAIVGAENFKAVEAAASAKEAQGKFADTSEAYKHVEEIMRHVKDVPELQNKVSVFAKLLKGDTSKQQTLVLDQYGKPLVTDTSGSQKTFKNLEFARRYFNDVAYGGNTDGFGGISPKIAKDVVKALDKSMGEFVPEFKAYKDTWRKMSEPLEAQNTKLGELMYSREGGLTGTYSKVADKDLPGKVFASKESIQLYTDALAGGRNAAPEAKAAASKTVQELALKYFQERTREMTPDAILGLTKNPKMADVMESLPGVKSSLGKGAQRDLSLMDKSRSLADQEKKAAAAAEQYRKKVADFKEARAEIRENLFRADTLARQQSTKSQNDAVTLYKSILNKARDTGGLSKEDYSQMVQMIDQVEVGKERAIFAHRLVKGIAWIGLGAAGAAGASAASHFAH